MTKWKIVALGCGPNPQGVPETLAEADDVEIARDIAEALALKHRGGWYQIRKEGPDEIVDGSIVRFSLQRWNG